MNALCGAEKSAVQALTPGPSPLRGEGALTPCPPLPFGARGPSPPDPLSPSGRGGTGYRELLRKPPVDRRLALPLERGVDRRKWLRPHELLHRERRRVRGLEHGVPRP